MSFWQISGREKADGGMMIRETEWKNLSLDDKQRGCRVSLCFSVVQTWHLEVFLDSFFVSPRSRKNPCLLILAPKRQPGSFSIIPWTFFSLLSLFSPGLSSDFCCLQFWLWQQFLTVLLNLRAWPILTFQTADLAKPLWLKHRNTFLWLSGEAP